MKNMVLRILLGIAVLALACIVVIAGAIFINSSDKANEFLDENGEVIEGSISEKVFVEINGVKQGMFIKGMDKTKPVLLFLHGGPGVTEQWINQMYPNELEDEFVVCWWEQRGAGISCSEDIPTETINNDQLVLDTIEVTNYLRERFNVDKIYLLGHSWGSTIGISTVEKAPNLYYAYIGMGQVTYLIEQEKMTYDYMIDYYTKSGDKKMLDKLLESPYTLKSPYTDEYVKIRDEVIHKAGFGTTHNMKSIIKGVFIPSFFANEYTFREKINLWKGKRSQSSDEMFKVMSNTDYSSKITKLEVPVYFFQGIYDYTSAYPLVKDYYNKLEAPIKGFYTFEESAHSPLFEEPEKFIKIIREDILKEESKLSD